MQALQQRVAQLERELAEARRMLSHLPLRIPPAGTSGPAFRRVELTADLHRCSGAVEAKVLQRDAGSWEVQQSGGSDVTIDVLGDELCYGFWLEEDRLHVYKVGDLWLPIGSSRSGVKGVLQSAANPGGSATLAISGTTLQRNVSTEFLEVGYSFPAGRLIWAQWDWSTCQLVMTTGKCSELP